MRSPTAVAAIAAGKCVGCHHCSELQAIKNTLVLVGALQGSKPASLLALVALRAGALHSSMSLDLTTEEAMAGADEFLRRALTPNAHEHTLALLRIAYPKGKEDE